MTDQGMSAEFNAPGMHARFDEFENLASSLHSLSGDADTISAKVRGVLGDPGFQASMRLSPGTASAVEARLDAALGGRHGMGSLSAELAADGARLRWSGQAYRDAESEACTALGGLLAELGLPGEGSGWPLSGAGAQPSSPPVQGVGPQAPPHRPPQQPAQHQPPHRPPAQHPPTQHPPAHHPAQHPPAHHNSGQSVSATRRTILNRAKSWSDRNVAYSSGVQLAGYRTDCSGFVSMCWGLPHSLTTASLPSVSHRIAAADLQPGDILLNTSPGRSGHAVMFDHWANSRHTAYMAYEETPGGCRHHVIPYPYYSGHGHFAPYRLNSLR
jgi:hypothetical protein